MSQSGLNCIDDASNWTKGVPEIVGDLPETAKGDSEIIGIDSEIPDDDPNIAAGLREIAGGDPLLRLNEPDIVAGLPPIVGDESRAPESLANIA